MEINSSFSTTAGNASQAKAMTMQIPAALNGSTYEQQAYGFTMAYAMVDYVDVMLNDVDTFSFVSKATHRGFWLGLSMRLNEFVEGDLYYNPALQQKAAGIFNRLSF